MTVDTTPRTRTAEAVDVSAALSMLIGCDILQTLCSGHARGRVHQNRQLCEMTLTVDSPPRRCDGCGAESDDLDGVARRAQFACLGLSP